MQSEISIVDLRIHPLDPTRIGPEGLVARFMGTLEAAVNDIEMSGSYAAMTESLFAVGDYRNALRAC